MPYDEEKIKRVQEKSALPYKLGGWLGMPYEGDDGCLRFLHIAFAELGVSVNGRAPDLRKDARLFREVDQPQFGDVAVFQHLPMSKYHVAMVLDWPFAAQCSRDTNGVSCIDVRREPWSRGLRSYWRFKECS